MVAERVPERSSDVVRIGAHSREEWIPLNKIVIPEYQRHFRPEWAAKIARTFDRKKFTKPEVARRVGGTYVVIDGQHRLAALRRIHGDAATIHVLCDVLDEMPIADEADIFDSRNSDVQKATSVDRLPSRLVKGDPRATRIRDIVERYGFSLRMQPGQKMRPGELSMASLEKIMRQHGRDDYGLIDRTLAILRSAYGTDERLSTVVVSGLGSFIAIYSAHPNYDERWLIKVLSQTSPSKLARDADALRFTLSTSQAQAGRKIILALYNHRKLEHKRLPEA